MIPNLQLSGYKKSVTMALSKYTPEAGLNTIMSPWDDYVEANLCKL